MAITITLLSILGYFGIGLVMARLLIKWSRAGTDVEHDDLVFAALFGAFWPLVLACAAFCGLWRGVVRIIAPEVARQEKKREEAAETMNAAKDLAKVASELEPDDPMCTIFFDQVEEMIKKAIKLGVRHTYSHFGGTPYYELGNYGDRGRQTWHIPQRPLPSKRRTVPEGAGLTVQEKRDLMEGFL